MMSAVSKSKETDGKETFNSFSTSDPNEDAEIHSFYQTFIHMKLFQEAHVSQTVVHKTINGRKCQPFAAYVISVKTKMLDYSIEKRYSCFRKLHKYISEKVRLAWDLPKKTLFSSSGTNDKVIKNRKIFFNELLLEMSRLNNSHCLKILYDFLGIRNAYTRQNIEIAPEVQASNKLKPSQEALFELLSRLEEQVLENLQEIERWLFQEHLKLSSEATRQLLIGLSNRKGLLTVALQELETEELTRWKALKLACRLMNFEQNRQAENFIRVFATCPVKYLKIHPELLESSQMKGAFFQLLSVYLKRNCDGREQAIGLVFMQHQPTVLQYSRWEEMRFSC